MKIIKLPPPMKYDNKELSAATLLREIVLTSPYWRAGNDLKMIEINLAIEQALDNSSDLLLKLTDDACEKLSTAMSQTPPIPLIAANRFFMQIFRAVARAEDAPES